MNFKEHGQEQAEPKAISKESQNFLSPTANTRVKAEVSSEVSSSVHSRTGANIDGLSIPDEAILGETENRNSIETYEEIDIEHNLPIDDCTPKIVTVEPSLPIDNNSSFEDLKIPDTIPFQSQGGQQMNKLYGFDLGSLGLVGERDGLKALNFDSLDLFTLEILRVHLLKICLTIFITEYRLVKKLYQSWRDVNLFFQIVLFQSIMINNITQKRSNLQVGGGVVETYYGIRNYFQILPKILFQMIYSNFISYNVSGLASFRNSVPLKYYPNSITIIFKMSLFLLPSPPPIPQPYLNANKQLQVPTKRQVQDAIMLRNEYLTQNRTHIAAERVRLSSEIAKFIVWNILQSPIDTINVYEETGFLWNNKSNDTYKQLASLSQSIINELYSFVSSCSNLEFLEILSIIPYTIILNDTFTGIRYEILEIFDENISNDRSMIIEFCDSRLDKENDLQRYGTKLYTSVTEKMPKITQLILVPGKDGERLNSLFGYTPLYTGKSVHPDTVIYFSNMNFGFKFYCQGLFTYALKMKQDEEKNQIDIEKSKSKSFLSRLSLSVPVSSYSTFLKSKLELIRHIKEPKPVALDRMD